MNTQDADNAIKTLLREAITFDSNTPNWQLADWFNSWRPRLASAIQGAAQAQAQADYQQATADPRPACSCELCWRYSHALPETVISMTKAQIEHVVLSRYEDGAEDRSTA